MKKEFTIACRGSKLSLAQVSLFQQSVQKHFPGLSFKKKIIKTRGDIIQDVALETIDGKDFFTGEIQEALRSGQADFAVHSLKDISSMDFFASSTIAITERAKIHDVAIFNPDIMSKLARNETIRIGTSSPRRTELGLRFLRKALPELGEGTPSLEAKLIRGNVDSRLKKLSESGTYDGVILALAGIDRLLADKDAKEIVSGLLQDKRKMLLPLLHCPPACNQGALVAEAMQDNTDASSILDTINDSRLETNIRLERKLALQYGTAGCSQMFGVFTHRNKAGDFGYLHGLNEERKDITHWEYNTATLNVNTLLDFSSLAHKAIKYTVDESLEIPSTFKKYFVTHKRAVANKVIEKVLKQNVVWTSGSSTWFSLAKRGIWVEGCLDGFGFESISSLWDSGWLESEISDCLILSNVKSKAYYPKSVPNVVAAYDMEATLDPDVVATLRTADAVFWSSFQHYAAYHTFLKEGVVQLCPAGRTADLLTQAGVVPIIFPNIKAFKAWKSIQ